MHGRHQRTLAAIFDNPVRSDIAWRDIESLLGALGASSKKDVVAAFGSGLVALERRFTDPIRGERPTRAQ